MNFYRRYIGDFQADTMSLSMMEQGAYDRLLDHYYATEKPIPLNSDRSAIICRAITLEERAAVTLVLDAYFERGPDGWYHPRVEKELELAKERSSRSSGAGKKGMESRWANNTDNKTDNNGDNKNDSKLDSNTSIPVTNKPLTTTPSTSIPISQETPVAPRKRAAARPKVEVASAATRRAYNAAYLARYGVDATWNTKTNTQLARFVESVPVEDAPAIAAFFLRSNKGFYVVKKHTVGILLADATTLRTEWLTGRHGTETEARQVDRTQGTANAFAPLIEAAMIKADT